MNMSAELLDPSIKYSSTSFSCINSHTPCHFISTCLLHCSVTGFEAMKMESWLSPQIGIGLS